MPVHPDEQCKLAKVAFASVGMLDGVMLAVVFQLVTVGGGQQPVEPCGDAPLRCQQVFALYGEVTSQFVHGHLAGLAVYSAVVIVVQPAYAQSCLPCPWAVLPEESELWCEVVHPDVIRAIGPARAVKAALIQQARPHVQAVFPSG